MTMNANEITKQALDFQKGVFASWHGAMSILQDQAALAVDTMLDQTSWIPDQGRQVISSWVTTCKNERDRLRFIWTKAFPALKNTLPRRKRPEKLSSI